MGKKISATCDCGAVRFTAEEEPVIQVCCHCADCRDASKADYVTIAFFKTKSVEISGPTVESTYTSDAGNRTARIACSNCGLVMFDRSAGFPSLIGVMAGRIEAPFEPRPACHVWVESKLPQVSIPAESPQYMKGIE